MNVTLPESARAFRIRTRRWTLLSAVGFCLALFALGIYILKFTTDGMTNKFSDVAVDRFMGYMVWVNVDLLRGYGLLAVVLTLVALPVVRWALRKKADLPGRLAVAWRALVVCAFVTLFCGVRMIHQHPAILGASGLDRYYFAAVEGMPGWCRDLVLGLLNWGPLLALAGCVLYYTASWMRRFRPQSSFSGVAFAGVSVLALLGGTAWAVPAWIYRSGKPVAVPARPNILILGSDSLRADHLSCNGYFRNTSPNIDALAAKSVNFRKCFTPIASTVESLTSMMTGQYPHTHGLQHMFPSREKVEKVLKESPNLPDELEKLGYDTAVMGDWCAGVFDMLPLGFDSVQATSYDNFKIYLSQTIYLSHPVLPIFYNNSFGYWLFPKLENCAQFVTPDEVTERVLDRIAVRSRNEKPFFLKVFYSCSHLPYSCGYPWSAKYADPAYRGPHRNQVQFSIDSFIGSNDSNGAWKKTMEADQAQIRALYDGCISKFDDCVGRILAQLEATGQLANTIILITADHGDDLFEPGTALGHGLTFNGGDQGNNIPAILHVPEHAASPRVVDHLARSIDFAPTLIDLAGGKPPAAMDGKSLAPYVRTPDANLGLAWCAETSYLFCRRTIPGEEPLYIPPMDHTTSVDESFDCHLVLKPKYEPLVLQTKERCLRTKNWKLVKTPGKVRDIVRLYALEVDPHCEKDVRLQYPQVFETMSTHLDSWIREKKEPGIAEIFPMGEPSAKTPAT